MLLKEVCRNHLRKNEMIFLRELITWETVSMERIVEVLYGDDPEGGPLNAKMGIHRLIFDLRRKIKKDWKIINVRTELYSLKKEVKGGACAPPLL